MTESPALTCGVEVPFWIETSGQRTVTSPSSETWPLLSASAEAVLGTRPQSSAEVGAVTVTEKLAPFARLAMSQWRAPLVIAHSVLSGFSAQVKPAGNVSSMSTLVAAPGPPLWTVIVKLMGDPATTVPPSGVLEIDRLGQRTCVEALALSLLSLVVSTSALLSYVAQFWLVVDAVT